MTGEKSGGSGAKSPEGPDFDDPLYVHPTDNVTGTIIGFKLTRTENFRIWKSSMTRALKSRYKLGFVEGTVVRPTDDPIKQSKWERANVVVCSWILGSLTESIYAGHACSDNSLDIWKELNETYFKSDGSVVFNLHQKINGLTQGGLSVSDYYNSLDSLWKEFDGLTNLTECTCTASTTRNDHQKLMKLMHFLNGLDECYNQVKSHILVTEPLPNVRSAFAIISREESFQKGGQLNNSQNKN